MSTRHTSAQSRQTERREARYSLNQRVLNGLYMTRLSRYRMIRLLPHPFPTISDIDRRHTGRMRKRDNLLTEKGGGGGGGAKSCDGEKAWTSINHSILSGFNHKIKTRRKVGFPLSWISVHSHSHLKDAIFSFLQSALLCFLSCLS